MGIQDNQVRSKHHASRLLSIVIDLVGGSAAAMEDRRREEKRKERRGKEGEGEEGRKERGRRKAGRMEKQGQREGVLHVYDC